MSFLEYLRKLLNERPRTKTLNVISHETGLTVSWLSSITTGNSANPGINNCEVLYNYLTKENLADRLNGSTKRIDAMGPVGSMEIREARGQNNESAI